MTYVKFEAPDDLLIFKTNSIMVYDFSKKKFSRFRLNA